MVRNQALSGLKIVGFVTGFAGPFVLTSLTVHGATVVLIESEKRPNVTRTMTPFKDNKSGLNRSYHFSSMNSDKYSMSLDLKHPRAREVVRKLVSWADVLVDNYRPGVMESLNLSYEEVRAIKPDIIMISLTQQGQTGPHRQIAAYGSYLAGHTGFITLTGWPDRSPVVIGAYPDYIAPCFGTVAVLAALDYRRKTGIGQYIDLSQYETSLQFLIQPILDYTVNNRIQTRNGNKCPCAAPHGVYRCKGDDKWCAIAVFTDSDWDAFRKVIGGPAWTQEKKFSKLAGRKEHEEELNQLVEEWTVDHLAEEVMIMMQQAGVRAGVVRTMGDVVENCSQLNHRHYWWRLEHPEMGETIYPGRPYILSKTPYQLQRPAPCLGEHTEYVCTQLLGMPDEEFIELLRSGLFK